jgi:hypothetical protein
MYVIPEGCNADAALHRDETVKPMDMSHDTVSLCVWFLECYSARKGHSCKRKMKCHCVMTSYQVAVAPWRYSTVCFLEIRVSNSLQ